MDHKGTAVGTLSLLSSSCIFFNSLCKYALSFHSLLCSHRFSIHTFIFCLPLHLLGNHSSLINPSSVPLYFLSLFVLVANHLFSLDSTATFNYISITRDWVPPPLLSSPFVTLGSNGATWRYPVHKEYLYHPSFPPPLTPLFFLFLLFYDDYILI